jgi:hypothetical protein
MVAAITTALTMTMMESLVGYRELLNAQRVRPREPLPPELLIAAPRLSVRCAHHSTMNESIRKVLLI